MERDAEQASIDAERLGEAERTRKQESLRAAEKTYQTLLNQQQQMRRSTLLTERDPELYVSPDVLNAALSKTAEERYNEEQAEFFVASSDYEDFRSDETFNAIGDYFKANGVTVADAKTIRAAFERLKSFGLVQPNPAPVKVMHQSEPVFAPVATQAELIPGLPSQSTYMGLDLSTGLEREFTEWEVERMGSDEYRRTFRLLTRAGQFFRDLGRRPA